MAVPGDEGGMLGYVQSESPEHWAITIEGRFQRGPKDTYRLTDGGTWTAVRVVPVLKYTYATRHSRPALGDLTVYHTLLDFRL